MLTPSPAPTSLSPDALWPAFAGLFLGLDPARTLATQAERAAIAASLARIDAWTRVRTGAESAVWGPLQPEAAHDAEEAARALLASVAAELAHDPRAFAAVTLVHGHDPWTEVSRLGVLRDTHPARALRCYVRRLRELVRAARA